MISSFLQVIIFPFSILQARFSFGSFPSIAIHFLKLLRSYQSIIIIIISFLAYAFILSNYYFLITSSLSLMASSLFAISSIAYMFSKNYLGLIKLHFSNKLISFFNCLISLCSFLAKFSCSKGLKFSNLLWYALFLQKNTGAIILACIFNLFSRYLI